LKGKAKYGIIFIMMSLLVAFVACDDDDRYEADWPSLKQHRTPRWLQDGKFGIYTHWGIYCYTATRGNAILKFHQCPGHISQQVTRPTFACKCP